MPYLPDVSQHPIYEPNGTIKIYHDVPLDSSYTHTFNSSTGSLASALESGQSSYLKYTLAPQGLSGGQSYSRLTEGSVRVEIFKGDLISCNYMQITNGINGENFPYWCFITDVEYVNNTTSDIFFEIDYLQTFWHRFTIPANFIEREHCLVSQDVIGKNMVAEQLETGELICHDKEVYNFTPRDLLICYSPNWSDGDSLPQFVAWDSANSKYDVVTYLDNAQVEEQFAPQIRTGIIGAQAYLRISGAGLTTKEMMGRLMSATIAIAKGGCKTISVQFVAGEITDSMWGNSASTFNKWVSLQTNFKSVDGSETFVPHNAKTLQYPFCQILVTNNNGSTETYHPELFNSASNQVNFGGKMYINPNAYAYIFPYNYRGLGEDVENGIGLDYFPQIPFSEDSYAQWWAQNKESFTMGIASQVLGTAFMVTGGASAGAISGGISDEIGASALQGMANARMAGDAKSAGRFKSLAFQAFEQENAGGTRSEGMGRMKRMALGYGAQNIAKSLSQIQTARNAPDSLTMSNGNGNLQTIQGRCGFAFYKMGLTIEMAKTIDMYFDMFGYATHKVKVPNFTTAKTARPAYDYIKMQNCFILAQTGDRGLPEVAQNAIQAIFNNGITVWRTLSQIGNYNVNNR